MPLALSLHSPVITRCLALDGGNRSIRTLRHPCTQSGSSCSVRVFAAFSVSVLPRWVLWLGIVSLLSLIPRPDTDNHRSSASVIGLYTSYATPIFLRITSGRDKLVPGSFTLGRWYLPIGAIAVAWVTFINILLMFPTVRPTTAKNMSEFYNHSPSPVRDPCHPDYSVVIIMTVFIYASLSWIFSARKWFTGPVRNVTEEPSPEYK